ncbi:MAG: DUF3052 domain-containing protein [Gammaproteobacteria bacterium]
MPATTHGYSGKPLYQKLGLKPGMRCLTINAPAHHAELMTGVEDVRFSARFRSADVVHLFCPSKATLTRKIDGALAKVADGGFLWISWPKKSSPLYKDLTEGDLRTVVLPTGWVDVKVCAVDADWSGLKFMRRRVR